VPTFAGSASGRAAPPRRSTSSIRAALAAARGLVGGRLIGVFQPHRYSRTRHLGRRFATCFDALDHLVVLPIYGAGEQPIEGVSSEIITRAVGEEGRVQGAGVEDWAAAHDRLVGLLRPGDALLTIGAGNVYQLGEAILADVKERASL
jgi:UDP-N-acetylmuramate--alanine ligase